MAGGGYFCFSSVPLSNAATVATVLLYTTVVTSTVLLRQAAVRQRARYTVPPVWKILFRFGSTWHPMLGSLYLGRASMALCPWFLLSIDMRVSTVCCACCGLTTVLFYTFSMVTAVKYMPYKRSCVSGALGASLSPLQAHLLERVYLAHARVAWAAPYSQTSNVVYSTS